MPKRPVLDFWYEFASPYSCLSALRIEALAEEAGVTLRWRPFLLGPIFAAQGWTTSPFNLFPNKGRYMWRDMARRGGRHGLSFVRPETFPQNSLIAARLALAGREAGWMPAFSKALFRAQFCEGRNIAEEAVLNAALKEAGADPRHRLPGSRAARRSRAGSRPRSNTPSRSASSGHRPSSPRMASCSGATIGSRKRSTGPGTGAEGSWRAWHRIARVCRIAEFAGSEEFRIGRRCGPALRKSFSCPGSPFSCPGPTCSCPGSSCHRRRAATLRPASTERRPQRTGHRQALLGARPQRGLCAAGPDRDGGEILVAAYRSVDPRQDNGLARVFRLAREMAALPAVSICPRLMAIPAGWQTGHDALRRQFRPTSGARSPGVAPERRVPPSSQSDASTRRWGPPSWLATATRSGSARFAARAKLRSMPSRSRASSKAAVPLGPETPAILPLPLLAQGATFDRSGGSGFRKVPATARAPCTGSTPRSGAVLASYAAPGGIEDLGCAPDGKLWAVSEAGSQRWSRWSTFYPLVFEIDPAS
jgi:2-hydroxychromene-2-carboxylate isomerase